MPKVGICCQNRPKISFGSIHCCLHIFLKICFLKADWVFVLRKHSTKIWKQIAVYKQKFIDILLRFSIKDEKIPKPFFQ